MKLIQAIREARRKRTPARVGRMSVTEKIEPLGPQISYEHLRVTYEAAIRFEVTGPEEALPEMRRKAEMAIAYEVFGELENEMMELRLLLWEEDFYRGSQDPVATKFDIILGKLKGETEGLTETHTQSTSTSTIGRAGTSLRKSR